MIIIYYYPMNEINNKHIFFALFNPVDGELIGIIFLQSNYIENYKNLTRITAYGFALAVYRNNGKTWMLKDYPHKYFDCYFSILNIPIVNN